MFAGKADRSGGGQKECLTGGFVPQMRPPDRVRGHIDENMEK